MTTEDTERLLAENARLRAALQWVMDQITAGVLVRDMSHDGDVSWALKMMEFMTGLNKMNAALVETREK